MTAFENFELLQPGEGDRWALRAEKRQEMPVLSQPGGGEKKAPVFKRGGLEGSIQEKKKGLPPIEEKKRKPAPEPE